jgi:hypothetical protein
MNSRFLASPGGRFANVALSLAFAVMAYASFSDGKAGAVRMIALGLLAVIAGFIVAAVLSVQEFQWYSLAIAVLVPMAGFYYALGVQLLTGAGAAVGSVLATMGVFVLLTGIVLGLRTSTTAPTTASGRARRLTTSNARA